MADSQCGWSGPTALPASRSVRPSAAQLERLVEREEVFAVAVDERYERLRPAVESETPMLEGQLLDDVRFILDVCTNHAEGVAGLRTALDGLVPADFLRATRRETTDPFEQGLLSVGDRTYGLLVNIVWEWLGEEALGGDLQAANRLTYLD